MPDAIITSTASTFGTISGTFAADQSTIVGTVAGSVVGNLSGSVGVPGPAGPGVPAGGTAGQYLQKIDGVDYNTDWVTLNLSAYAPLNSPLFTGDPRGPTAALGDSDTSLATMAFVQQELLSGTANAKNLEVYVRNQTGSTLAAGAIVYINGATGNRPTVTLAQANNDANSAQTFGFVKTAIANNGFGYVIVRGELENIDTHTLTEGVQLYLSPTTPGAWTTTKPSAPQHLVYVGIVVRAHPTQGVILVAVQNGYELNELHDVAISSPTNGQVLKYNSSTGLWYNGTDTSGVAWGGITGTLSAQTDLQTALDGKYSTSNPAGYITSSALTPYLLSSTAASTYYPLTNPSGYITSSALTGYATESWVTSQGYITSSALAGYATESWVTSQGYLTDAPSDGNQYARKDGAWDIVSAGSSYITSVSSPLTVTSGDLSIDLSAYATQSWVSGQGYLSSLSNLTQDITFDSASSVGRLFLDGLYDPSSSGFTSAKLNFGTSSPNSATNGDFWTDGTNFLYHQSGSTSTVASTSFVTGQGYITSSALAPYLTSASASATYFTIANAANKANIASPTFTGKVTTAASATGSAPLNIPQGTAPSAPVNGDVWSTSTGVFARVNGVTQTLNTGIDYQVYTTPGTATWTKPANAKWVEVVMFGGGGGGGSGARQATASGRSGGGGGGGAPYVIARFAASFLGATETVTVGAGGTGGAAVATDNTNGNNGTAGGNTTFANLRAFGGQLGSGGTTTTGAAGLGLVGYIQGGTGLTSGIGGTGQPGGGTTPASLSGNNGYVAMGGGGGSGAPAASTTSVGGAQAANKTTNSQAGIWGTITGGAGGTTAGVAPVTGTSGLTIGPQGGMGGGGGAYRTAVAGMAGAVGGLLGGGGGGGSASDNGFASGAGGNGGAGGVIVITYS